MRYGCDRASRDVVKNRSVNNLVNPKGLALLVDPGRQILGGRINRKYPALETGADVVENGDFSDFTFPDRHSSEFTNAWTGNVDDASVLSDTELLSETDFATHASWDVTGDVDDSGGNAAFTFAAGSLNGTLTQTAANRASAGSNSTRYRFTYTVAVTTAPDGDFALQITNAFASSAVDLDVTAGTHTVEFISAAGADSADFVLEASETTATQGEFTIDDVTLKEVKEGIVADWKLNDQYQVDKSHYLVGNRYAAKFDGESSYLSFSDITVDKDSATIAFTIANVDNRSDAVFDGVLGNSSDGNTRMISYHPSTGRLYIETNTASDIAYSKDFVWADGQSSTYIITLSSGTAKYYKNGVALSMLDGTVTGDVTFNQIGRLGPNTFNFKDFLKDIQIWSKPLSSAERTQVLNGTIPSDGLVANWQFDDPDTWLLDQSGNGHDLINSGVELVHGNAGFIGQDWARGGGLKGEEEIENGGSSNSTDWTDTNEDGVADNWSSNGSGTITIETSDVYSGNKAQKIFSDGTGTKTQVFQDIIHNNGSIYKLSFYSKYSGGGSAKVEQTSFDPSLSLDLTGDSNWTYHEHYYYYDGQQSIYFWIKDGSPTDYLIIDNVSIKEISNGHHLKPNGGLLSNTYDEASPAYSGGYAQKFDGIDDYLSLPAAQAADFNSGVGDFSISGWFRLNNIDKYQTIYNKGSQNTSQDWVTIRISSLNEFQIYISDGSGGVNYWAELNGSTSLSNNTWYHFALTVSDGSQIIYLNAIPDATDSSTDRLPIDSSSDLEIGTRYGAFYFDGHISDLTYHNRALSANEVKELYRKGKFWGRVGDISYEDNGFVQRITNTDSNSHYIYQTKDVTEGSCYKLTYNAYRVSGSGDLTLIIDKDADETYTHNNTSSQEFTRYFHADGDEVTIKWHGTNTGDVYEIDNVTLTEVTNAEWSGTTVTDYSGNENHGTMMAGLEESQPANPAALWFDGVDDYGDFGNICTFERTNPVMFVFWLKNDKNLGNQVIFRQTEATTAKGYVVFINSGYITIDLINNWGGGNRIRANYSSKVTDGQWHFISIVYRGDSNASNIEFYVDAAKKSTTVIYNTLSASIKSTANLFFGSTSTGDYLEDYIGLSGIYIFDGQNGRPSSLPSNYESSIIEYNYTKTRAEMVKLGLIEE